MLEISLELLAEKGLQDVCALGGGTALSALYWGHRYSTDIDMFIHQKEDVSKLFRPNQWSPGVTKQLYALGYKDGDYKGHPVYAEISIEGAFKMQYFSVNDRTEIPYVPVKLWDMELLAESVEEIIAKKIYYRADMANARDLFDIALAIHKNPNILDQLAIPFKKIETLFQTITLIEKSTALKEKYLLEIDQMNPHPKYKDIAVHTIAYLYNYLENICGAHALGMTLTNEECKELETYAFEQVGRYDA